MMHFAAALGKEEAWAQYLESKKATNGNTYTDCPHCDRKCSVQRLEAHILSAHTPHTCMKCGKTLSNKYALNQHESTIHGDKGKQHSCEICGKRLFIVILLSFYCSNFPSFVAVFKSCLLTFKTFGEDDFIFR
jgi:DNA-directed RNA polymerase subunit RPC12/RpoP